MSLNLKHFSIVYYYRLSDQKALKRLHYSTDKTDEFTSLSYNGNTKLSWNGQWQQAKNENLLKPRY